MSVPVTMSWHDGKEKSGARQAGSGPPPRKGGGGGGGGGAPPRGGGGGGGRGGGGSVSSVRLRLTDRANHSVNSDSSQTLKNNHRLR